MSILLPLKRSKSKLPFLQWKSCLPFVENSRGVLIHRPRYVALYKIHKYPHIAVGYWCKNGSTGDDNFTFLSIPPEGKLVCKHCEMNAVEAGLPSTDALAGKHIHLGIVVPQQTCCMGG